jgi:hypothetical protein
MKYFLDRINKQSYCWTWVGSIGHDGYGRAYYKGKNNMAHRAVYRAFVDEIPPEMTIDHLCRNKLCVNPEHLQVASQRDNILRSDNQASINTKKTHCVNGHEYTAKNTYSYKASRGKGIWRACKTCRGMTLK